MFSAGFAYADISIFTNMKLWIAVARHNFKSVKINFANVTL